MSAITLDPDIGSATAELPLRKIETQQYRNALEGNTAREAEALAWAKSQAALTLREQVVLALASKFMTKSTSGVAATYTATSVLDGDKLRVAVDEVLKAARTAP